MKKLLNQTNRIIIISFLAAACFFTGCGKEKSKKNFVARVDDSYLSADDISKDLDTSGLQLSHKNEYVRNWIETELFYNEAVNEGILKDETFKRILDKSKKELAKAYLKRKILEQNPIEFRAEHLEEFFNLHRDEFRLSNVSYFYNKIIFTEENKAILFRNALVESDWSRAINVFGKDKSILSEKSGIFENDFEIQPKSISLAIQELQPNEVTIVINTEPNEFTVVQLIRKYLQNEIPEFEAVRTQIAEKYQMRKREQLLHDYLKNLYTKHKIELKSGK